MSKKSEIIGFCLFDFANSAYTTVILTAVYCLYFTKNIGSEFMWSMTLALSYLVTLLISPVAGAMADFSAGRKRFLVFSTLLCVSTTGLLFFSSTNHIAVTLLFIVLSNAGFSLSEVFVSSFLPGISTQENIGRISGYAWSFGYVGGMLSLVMSLAFIMHFKGPQADFGLRFNNILIALFFGIFAIPSLVLLKDKTEAQILPKGEKLLFVGFRRIRDTFRDIQKHRDLFKFLTAFFVFSCGMVTVITFAGIFAQNVLGFGVGEVIKLIFVANITSAIGAFYFGFVQDKIGAKRTLQITLLLWLIAVLGAFFVQSKGPFWIIANVVGFAMGATQSASRSIVGSFSPKDKIAEFYGFWAVASRAASIVGLFSFGWLLKGFGSMRIAILCTALFFVIGFILVSLLKEERPKTHRDEFADILGK